MLVYCISLKLLGIYAIAVHAVTVHSRIITDQVAPAQWTNDISRPDHCQVG
jgi:hypothetical protein